MQSARVKSSRRPDHPGKTRPASWWLDCLGTWLGRLFYRVRVEGLEHLPENGPVLVIGKHQRNDDIPLGYAFVLMRRRWDNWSIMKDELRAWWYGGFFLKCGGLPINRERPMRSRVYLRLARQVLHNGHLIVLYPEQTFFENCMGPAKIPGFRFLVRRSPGPVAVVSLGYKYDRPGRFGRTELIMQLAAARMYHNQCDPGLFLHETMGELARLSHLEYEHAPPRERPVVTYALRG